MSDSNLKQLAQLAYINLEPETMASLSQDIESIRALIDQLQAVDTQGVKPLIHPHDIQQRLREDNAILANHSEALAQIAPAYENEHFLVPKVIDSGK